MPGQETSEKGTRGTANLGGRIIRPDVSTLKPLLVRGLCFCTGRGPQHFSKAAL